MLDVEYETNAAKSIDPGIGRFERKHAASTAA
jgi:hypothetical protein